MKTKYNKVETSVFTTLLEKYYHYEFIISLTSAPSTGSISNCCKIFAIAIFVSTIANRDPIQLRGPAPKGKKVNGLISPLFLDENLNKMWTVIYCKISMLCNLYVTDLHFISAQTEGTVRYMLEELNWCQVELSSFEKPRSGRL